MKGLGDGVIRVYDVKSIKESIKTIKNLNKKE